VQYADRRISRRGKREPWIFDSATSRRTMTSDPAPPRRATSLLGNTMYDDSLPSTLVDAVVDARYVRGERGARLRDALAALPPERQALGIAAMSAEEVEGTDARPGLCEDPAFDLTVNHSGAQWELRYVSNILVLTEAMQPALYALSSECTAALSTAGADVARAVGAGCAVEDEAAHFPVGSACRTCLSTDGNHGRCVTAGACRALMTREVFYEGTSYDVVQGRMLACAPDVMTTVTMLARELGEDNARPKAFDHNAYFAFCLPFTPAGESAPVPNCVRASDANQRPARSDVLMGFVDYIRRPGQTGQPHHNRLWAASRVEVEGAVFEDMPLYPGGLAGVSEDFDHDGFGLPPNTLRPGGTDRSRIEDTFALDWLGAVAMKTSTNIDGVPIYTYNHNLCTTWSAPAADGHSTCQIPIFTNTFQPADDDRWKNDWAAYLAQRAPLRIVVAPVLTLASTGRIDPSVPGGHVPQVMGSTTLADPEWENCRWPTTFVPDEMANYETVDFPGEYTFTSQTWRLGRTTPAQARVMLATNWRRNFCFQSHAP
jgi:hypothetical protein